MRRLLGASIRYAVTDTLAKAMPYGLLALASIKLRPVDFVQISIAVSFINILSGFISFGSKELATSAFATTTESKGRTQQNSPSALILIGAGISLVASIPLSSWVSVAPLSEWWFWLACIISSFVIATSQLHQLILSLNQDFSKASYLKLVSVLPLTNGIAAALIAWKIPLVAFSVASISSSIFIAIILKFQQRTPTNHQVFGSFNHKTQISIGFLYGTSSLLGVAFSYLGQFILTANGNTDQAAIFSLCILLMMTSSIFSNAINQAYTPQLLRNTESPSSSPIINYYYGFICAITSIAIMGSTVFVGYFSKSLWPTYNTKHLTLSLIILGQGFIFNHISYLYRLSLHKLGKDIHIVIFTIAVYTLTTPILFIFSRFFHNSGALLGTASGYLLIGLISAILMFRGNFPDTIKFLLASIPSISTLVLAQLACVFECYNLLFAPLILAIAITLLYHWKLNKQLLKTVSTYTPHLKNRAQA